MEIKYRLNDLAKDLNIPAKELTDLLESQFSVAKKNSANLTEQELDFIFNAYTKKFEVSDLTEYFARQQMQNKKEKSASDAPKAKADGEAAKSESKKEKAVKTPAAEKQTAKKAEQKSEPKAANKPAEKQAQKKPEADRTPDNAGEKKSANAQNTERAKAEQRKKDQKAHKPHPKMQTLERKLKNDDGPAITQNRSEQDDAKNLHRVDTRTANVELDKYNERYEQIAPANRMKESVARKQKITQKSAQRARQQYSKKETEAQKLQRLALERARKQQLKVLIPDEITVSELATRLKANVGEVIKKLMMLGVMASQNEIIDFDTAAIVAEEMGAKVEKEVVVTIEERLFEEEVEDDANAVERCPVVVVMGHVDHGKTSLLDYIRNSNVTEGEAGGITQHIGAYKVKAQGRDITFLDTPGHEAFTAMRARGASVTDVAIIVVAADDGIMPQTVEAINHAKAAGLSIVVAINKMDKPEANPDRVLQELTEYELVPEEWGGDVICVPVSAKTGEGVDKLLEMVLLVSDMKELKANPARLAKGAVIEARLDKGRGPVATLLVQNGTLKQGDIIIAGTAIGHVRVMKDDKGREVKDAGPSTPVEITGLTDVPAAGDVFNAVENERLAKELIDQRKHTQKEEQFKAYQKVTLDNLFSQIAEGEMKELAIVVKADVQGSAEAVKQSLEKISNEEVRVRVIHNGVGAISKSDVMLAQASGAIIIGFNVRPDPVAKQEAEEQEIEIRLYRIIYDAIDDVKQAMKGMLAPKTREVQLGRAEVRQVYKISSVGTIAGSYVLEGKVLRNAQIRLVRDGIVIVEDEIKSLKRFKDDAKEVLQGFECGIGLEKFNDIKEGDIFESFMIEEYRD